MPFIPGLTSSGVNTTTVGSVEELLLGPTGRDPNTPSLLPPELAASGVRVSRPIAGLAADDPRVALMEQGYSAQEIEQAVAALQSAPIDIEGAQAGVTTATENEQQFWTEVYGNLTSEQVSGLQPLAEAIESAPDPAAAQSAFESQLVQLLSPEQLAQLRTLRRASEDAQLNLQGQQLGQRLNETQLSSTMCAGGPDQITQDPYALARADARVFISGQRQILANRRVEDAMTTLMTPETQQALAPQQQSMIEAAAAVRANPNDAGARQRLETAQILFNHALAGRISASDKTALDGLIDAADSESALGSMLSGEAATQHRLMDLSLAAESRGGSLNDTERKVWDLARGEYALVVQSRALRSLAVQAATSENSEALLGQLNDKIGEVLTARADQSVNEAQFNLDIAAYLESIKPPEEQTSALGSPNFEGVIPQAVPTTLTPAPAANGQPQPLTVGAEFAAYLPSSIPSVADATSFLASVRTERDELQDQLNPETPHKGFWERALDVGMGVGEVAAGVAVMAAAGWTGVGAVVGGVIIAHGLMNTVHSATDWATDAETATPLSRGLQTLGVNEGAADRIDMGVSFVGMTAAGGIGAAGLLLRSAGMLGKGAGLLSGAIVVDTAQAQGRYVLANDAATPLTIDTLTALGLSETQANYAMLGGSMIAVGGLAAAGAARTVPVRAEPGFREFAAGAGEGSQGARIADWHGRAAPREVRESVASALLGPEASSSAVSRTARGLRANTLVVIRDSETLDVTGAAVVKPNSTGRFGRNPLGDKAPANTSAIVRVAGDEPGVQQAIAAAAEGTELFTTQSGITWFTGNPADVSQSGGRFRLKDQRVSRDAVATFDSLTAEQRPARVSDVHDSSLTWETQAGALAEIPIWERYNWPAGTRQLLYGSSIPRPPMTLGSTVLGKIMHPLHAESYMSRLNNWINPPRRAIDWWERKHPQVSTVMEFPAENGRPAMTARLNKPHSLSEEELYQVASRVVDAERYWGVDSYKLDLVPASSRVNLVMEDLRAKRLITVWDESDNLVGGATVGLRAGELPADGMFSVAAAINRNQPGTAYLADAFWTAPQGWSPVVTAAEQVAGAQGARSLLIDPALPIRVVIDSQRSRWQSLSWYARDRVVPAFDRARDRVSTVTDTVSSAISRPLQPITDFGSRIGGHVNPYKYPKGVELDPVRQFLQESRHFVRYAGKELVDGTRGAALLTTLPQAATGNVDVVTNDSRTVRPFNGLPGHSVSLYFPWSGTMVTLWGNGPNVRGPVPLDPNGLQPQARVRPALHDPNGPNSAGILSTVRLILGGEVNLGVRYFGSNDGISAQTTLSMRLGRFNSSLRSDIPVQPGGPKGMSLASSLTMFAPSMSHAFFAGPVGVTVRSMRTNMLTVAQTAPIDAGARAAGYRGGDRYTIGGARVGGGTGFYFTLNPAYGDPEYQPK